MVTCRRFLCAMNKRLKDTKKEHQPEGGLLAGDIRLGQLFTGKLGFQFHAGSLQLIHAFLGGTGENALRNGLKVTCVI